MQKFKHFIQQSWLLIVASFCFGLLIASTNAALSERIKQNEQDKLYNLMRGLITQADDFQRVTNDEDETDIYKALDDSNSIIGFAFIAAGPGFQDKIKLVIAVDETCKKFFGFKVLASNETPGFGSKIKEDFFADQFKNAPTEKLQLTKTGNAEKIDRRIVAITGATVSSEAVVKIFNSHIKNIKQDLQAKGLIQNGI